MSNPFENRMPSLRGPATDLVPVVPSDLSNLPEVAVSLYVENGGSLSFVSVAGGIRNVTVADHSILPVGVLKVMSLGTTATGIHALVLT